VTVAQQFWEKMLVPWKGRKVDDGFTGQCESYLKVRLPESFVALYRAQYGGVSRRSHVAASSGQRLRPGAKALMGPRRRILRRDPWRTS